MKKLLFFLLLLSCAAPTMAQQRILDSLSNLLKNPPADHAARYNLLETAATAYSEADMPAEAFRLSDEMVRIAKASGKEYYIADAYKMIGQFTYDTGNYQAAIKWHEQSIKISEHDIKAHQNPVSKKMVGETYGELSMCYTALQQFDNAVFYLRKAIYYNQKIGMTKNTLNWQINLGVLYRRSNNYKDAVTVLHEAFQTYSMIGADTAQLFYRYRKGTMYGTIANIFGDMNNSDSSLYYNKKQIEHFLNMGDRLHPKHLLSAYENLLTEYIKTENWQEGVIVADTLTSITGRYHSTKDSLEVNALIARLYALMPEAMAAAAGYNEERYNRAVTAIEAVLESNASNTSRKIYQMQYTLALSKIYERRKQYDKALSTYRKGVVMKDSIINDEKRQEMLRRDIQAYFVQHEDSIKLVQQLTLVQLDRQRLLVKQKEQALALSNKEQELQQLAYQAQQAELLREKTEKEKQAALAQQSLLETKVKDRQIAAQHADLDYNHKMNTGLSAGAALLLLGGGVVYRNQRKTARLNRLVSSQNEVLEQQKEHLSAQSERLATMMRELNHRVKNNLQVVSSLLNLQSYQLEDEIALAAINESNHRVQAMSLLHQRLYKTEELTHINMKEYISELTGFLSSSYGYDATRLNLQLDVSDEWLDIDMAMPIGLILNELVTNAFKYAYEGVSHPRLEIRLKHTGNMLDLEVKDNGKGVDKTIWNHKDTSSFGRQLVRALCSQLRAREEVKTENGSFFHYQIPAAA